MKRIGKTPGSGRKPNTPNKFTVERAERAAREGPLPHENILHIARILMTDAMAYRAQEVTRINKDGVEEKVKEFKPGHEAKFHDLLMKALTANEKAAPYYAPRRSSVAVTHAPIDPSLLTDEEVNVLERIATRISEAVQPSQSDLMAAREIATRH
jgi:hypothetical protein